MINVEKVTKKFGDFLALDDMTLNVKSGSAYGLLGSNGAGKSTLLRILAGIYKQDSGSVTVDGEKIYDNVAVKQRIFYVSDDVEQYANMTPEDMRKMYEVFYPTFSKEKFDRLMTVVDLPRDKRMSTFSKGTKAFMETSFWYGHVGKRHAGKNDKRTFCQYNRGDSCVKCQRSDRTDCGRCCCYRSSLDG